MAKRSRSDDESEEAPVSTKVKSTTDHAVSLEPEYDADKRPFWKITADRRVTINEFKGKVMVDVREFYAKDGGETMLPGKKGISLPMNQFNALVELLPALERELGRKGVAEVARPKYADAGNGPAGHDDKEDGEGGEGNGAGEHDEDEDEEEE